MIIGISHITFIVKDLERTAHFLKEIFEAKEVYSSLTVKYFQINDLWIALNKGEPLPERTYNHVAFQIQESDMNKYIERIKNAGAEIRLDRQRAEGEGRSVYFYDFDNHLFELHTGTLAERLSISPTLDEQLSAALEKANAKEYALETDENGTLIIDKDKHAELYDWAVNG